MSMFRLAWLALALAVPGTAGAGGGPGLGQPATAAAIAAWNIDVGADGAGLPAGGGSARQGAALFAAQCEACHGNRGGGGPHDRLVGGIGTLASEAPVKTVGSFWPYAPTLFDYIRRAMPLAAPQSLSDDQVYALTAYILAANGLIDEDQAMTAETLPEVRMPNRDGFVSAWPSPAEGQRPDG